MNRLQEINKELKELWSDESWIKLEGREGNVKLHEDLSILNVDKHHQMIHHPLLIATFNGNDFLTTQANLHYESKCIQVKNALEDKDINMYVVLHERPYRVDALYKAYDEWWMPNDKEYWQMVSWMWIDSENIYEHKYLWKDLLTKQYSNSHFLMEESELETFNNLPDTITIYRGGMDDKGFSWTLSKEKAEWFANRWLMNGNLRDKSNISGKYPTQVFEKTINKSDALAYLNGRGEEEIIYVENSNEF